MYSIKNESRLEIQVQKLFRPLFVKKNNRISVEKVSSFGDFTRVLWVMRPRFRPLGNTAANCCMQDDLDPPDPSPKSAPSSH